MGFIVLGIIVLIAGFIAGRITDKIKPFANGARALGFILVLITQ